MTTEQELEATYGPAAPFSEHKRGERITWRSGGSTHTGVIQWVAAAGMIATTYVEQRYIVAPEPPTGFVDIVFPGDIIEDPEEAQEPALVSCKYCGQLHEAGQVEQCSLKPNR